MFIHNIDPTLFKIWILEIRWYGLVYVIGFLLLYYVLNKKRDELKLEKKDVENFVLWILIGVIVGARLFMLVWEPVYYFSNPLRILMIWQGGMALHGGVIGALIAGYFLSKKYKINLAKLADVVVIPAIFALALGRIANFINGEIIGTVSNLRLCIDYSQSEYIINPPAGCRYPVQLCGALGRFVLFGYLFFLDKTKKFKDGFLFWNFIFFMGLGRFVIDFLREDPRVLGLSMGQYLSLLMFLIGGFVLWKYYRKSLYRIFYDKQKKD